MSRAVLPREQARLLQDSESGALRTVAVLQAPFSELGLNEPEHYVPAVGRRPSYSEAQDYRQPLRGEEYHYYSASHSSSQHRQEEAYY